MLCWVKCWFGLWCWVICWDGDRVCWSFRVGVFSYWVFLLLEFSFWIWLCFRFLLLVVVGWLGLCFSFVLFWFVIVYGFFCVDLKIKYFFFWKFLVWVILWVLGLWWWCLLECVGWCVWGVGSLLFSLRFWGCWSWCWFIGSFL